MSARPVGHNPHACRDGCLIYRLRKALIEGRGSG